MQAERGPPLALSTTNNQQAIPTHGSGGSAKTSAGEGRHVDADMSDLCSARQGRAGQGQGLAAQDPVAPASNVPLMHAMPCHALNPAYHGSSEDLEAPWPAKGRSCGPCAIMSSRRHACPGNKFDPQAVESPCKCKCHPCPTTCHSSDPCLPLTAHPFSGRPLSHVQCPAREPQPTTLISSGAARGCIKVPSGTVVSSTWHI